MRLFYGWSVLFVIIVGAVGAGGVLCAQTVAAPSTSTDSPSAGIQPEPSVPLERLALDPHFKVTKVHIVNNTESYKTGGNRALEFERSYWNYGALTKEEIEARRGLIYLISWTTSGAAENLTARFEYRLVNTKEKIYTQTQNLTGVSGTNRSLFEVVGDEFRKNGAVYAWRFTLLRGDAVVALERSYIW